MFATASLAASGVADAGDRRIGWPRFLAIGSGAAGCALAGYLADRMGKARVAMWAMVISASCAALTLVVFGRRPCLVFALVMVWGFSVVADSAQFSALVSEHAPPDHVGTALTLQTCVGFLLTMVTIERCRGWRRQRAGSGRRCCSYQARCSAHGSCANSFREPRNLRNLLRARIKTLTGALAGEHPRYFVGTRCFSSSNQLRTT